MKMERISSQLKTIRSLHDGGFCVSCGKSTIAKRSHFQLNLGSPMWLCEKCNSKQRAHSNKRYKENISLGRCGNCGSTELKTKVLCSKCSDKWRDRQREAYNYLVSIGRCTKCRKPNDGHTSRCSECNEKRILKKQ